MPVPLYGGDTKQLVIMQRLTTLLEGVTTANGYGYNLTGHVFRGKSVFGANEVLPFVSILESLRPDPTPLEASSEQLLREEEWELLIQGWAKTTQDRPTDELYKLKGALEHRLALIAAVDTNDRPVSSEHYRLGRILTSVRIGPGVVRAAAPQAAGAEALYLPVLVRYVMNVADPWSLT